MSKSLNRIQLFEDCSRAMEHSKAQIASTQRFGSLFRWNLTAEGYREEFDRILRYLKNARWHATTHPDTYVDTLDRIEKSASNELFAAADVRSAQYVLISLIKALSCTASFLLQDMTAEDMSKVAGSAEKTGVVHLLDQCKQQKSADSGLLRKFSDDYEKKIQLTTDDLIADLIVVEFSRNKLLNKPKQTIHDQVENLVNNKIEKHWQAHLDELSELQQMIDSQKAVVERWDEKIDALERVLENTEEDKIWIGHTVKESSGQFPSAELEILEQTPVPWRVAEDDLPQTSVISTPGVEFLVRSALSSQSPKRPARPLTPSHSVSSVTPTDQSPYNIHNRGSRPKVLLLSPSTGKNKKALNTAFSGLDQYAKTMFARSPASNGTQRWTR